MMMQEAGQNVQSYEPFTEIFNTFRGECVIIPLPGELRLDKAPGCQTLERFDDLKIWNVEVFVFRGIEILFGDKNAL